jgi:malic enzyme
VFAFTIHHTTHYPSHTIHQPTVGEACVKFANIFRHSEGMYLSAFKDRGMVRRILDNWSAEDVDIIVVTDGSRILGLGDLGINGMGIPVGKLSLYVVASGFHPRRTLPITLDTGTNNGELRESPFYLGERKPRLGDEDYFSFVNEFVEAVKDKWPSAILQWEDFSNDHCFCLLEKYRKQLCTFNDDIQVGGEVAVVVVVLV